MKDVEPIRPDTGVIRRRRFRRPLPSEWEFWDLATYNAECYRGIVHTPEYDARMAVEQERFNNRGEK
jgi:hypothetical protein